MKILIVPLFVLICSVSFAFADIYSWTDDNGIESFTDNPGKIPKKYRKTATPVEGSDGASSGNRHSRDADSGSFNVIDQPHAEPAGNDNGKHAKAERIQEWRDPPGNIDREKLQIQAALAPLAETLKQGANSDREKALAAYDWIYKYINYDKQELRNYIGGKSTTSQDALTVAKTQKGVCLGFANLFEALAVGMGLESEVVTGLGAGGYVLGIGYFGPHAWNAVKIDGKWELVDTVFRNFLSPPDKFITKHFPYDPKWQLLDPPLSREAWQKKGSGNM